MSRCWNRHITSRSERSGRKERGGGIGIPGRISCSRIIHASCRRLPSRTTRTTWAASITPGLPVPTCDASQIYALAFGRRGQGCIGGQRHLQFAFNRQSTAVTTQGAWNNSPEPLNSRENRGLAAPLRSKVSRPTRGFTPGLFPRLTPHFSVFRSPCASRFDSGKI